jgi:hypothetical protein
MPHCREQFRRWADQNHEPIDNEHILNCAINDRRQKRDHEKFMDQFELQGFTTPAQRVEKLKELLVRFNMPTDIFDKKRQHDENCLFRCFISNDENPYLKVKAARNTKDALVRSRYMDNPM